MASGVTNHAGPLFAAGTGRRGRLRDLKEFIR